MDQRLNIIVGADVQQVQAGMNAATASVKDMEKELNLLGIAITNALDRGQDVAKLEDAYSALQAKIKATRAEAAQPIPAPKVPPIPAPDDSAFLGSLSRQRIAFLDLGRIVTGQGFSLRSLAANFSLLGPAVTIAAAAIYGIIELLNRQTDAEKKASQEAEKLKQFMLNLQDAGDVTLGATGLEEGSIARVQALAAAVRDSNSTYAERKNALDQLRETNKAYFGDLTLEGDSLKTLTSRVADYSNALITEAVVKGQVEEIAKVSAELEKQAHVLTELKDTRGRAQTTADKTPYVDNQAGALGDIGQNKDAATAANAVVKTTNAFKAQQEVVDKLSTSIAAYKGELQKNVALQLEQKPLTTPPVQKDDLKSIIPVLEQIQRIYEDIRKPTKEPLFQQQFNSTDGTGLSVIEAQIKDAIRKGAVAGAGDPAVRQAYDDLATALRAKLAHVENPNLSAHINYTLADPGKDPSQQIESALEKTLSHGALHVRIPVDIEAQIRDAEQAGATPEELKALREILQKKVEDAKKNIPAIQFNVPVKFGVSAKELSDQIAGDLNLALQQATKKFEGDLASSAFKDIGVAIGNALAGQKNPIQSAIRDFTTTLGDGLVKIGETMIAASTLMVGLKAALGGLFGNPAGGLVEGIAAIAIGTAVKDIGVHAFASGGIVTGPTLGLIGEAGPEVVFPLSKLNDFAQGFKPNQGTTNVAGQFTISGHDMRLVLARADKNANLVSKSS